MEEHRTKTGSDISNRKSCFLLVVDSDTDSLLYTTMLLKRFDYKMFMAKTAREALQMAMVVVPSLFIIDLVLKDMNGLDLIRDLRRNPNIADVPFIVLRRPGDLDEEMNSAELGAVDCLDQPVSAEQLFRAVQAAIEKTPRTNIRIRTSLHVKVHNMPFYELEGACTSELSERGMFLRTRSPAAVDTRLSLQMDVNGRIIEAEAVVIYSDLTGGTSHQEPGMGLEFVRIAEKDREIIRQFITDEIMRDITAGNA